MLATYVWIAGTGRCSQPAFSPRPQALAWERLSAKLSTKGTWLRIESGTCRVSDREIRWDGPAQESGPTLGQ